MIKLTDRQRQLLRESTAIGPVLACGQVMRAARQLEAKGIGKVTSTPGANYTGRTLPITYAYGGYYVAPNWKWDDQVSGFIKISNESH